MTNDDNSYDTKFISFSSFFRFDFSSFFCAHTPVHTLSLSFSFVSFRFVRSSVRTSVYIRSLVHSFHSVVGLFALTSHFHWLGSPNGGVFYVVVYTLKCVYLYQCTCMACVGAFCCCCCGFYSVSFLFTRGNNSSNSSSKTHTHTNTHSNHVCVRAYSCKTRDLCDGSC